ncbi:MAG: DUF1398 domain-containing protein [Hyphomonas sp.]
MDAQKTAIAQNCLAGSYADTLSFPEAVGALTAAGFEGYLVDYRANTRTHYLPSGEALILPNPEDDGPVAEAFEAGVIAAAIRWAQSGAADYTYAGFSRRVAQAGCAGYLASFRGRCVVYFGRKGETHTEHFPQ